MELSLPKRDSLPVLPAGNALGGVIFTVIGEILFLGNKLFNCIVADQTIAILLSWRNSFDFYQAFTKRYAWAIAKFAKISFTNLPRALL